MSINNLEFSPDSGNDNVDKFSHLKLSSATVEWIENVPLHLLDKEQLPYTRNHFKNLIENLKNPQIQEACIWIISKIDDILIKDSELDWIKKTEIGRASNDPYYSQSKAA